MLDFWRGMESFFAGVGFAFSTPGVRRRLGLALVVMLLVFAGSLVLGWWLATTLADYLLAGGELAGWQEMLAKTLAVALGLVVGFLLYWALGPLAVSPWMDAIAAESLRALGVQPRERGVWSGLRASWAVLVWGWKGFVRWGLAALVLWPVPVAGQLLAPLAWSAAGARLLAPELVEPAAAALGMEADALRAELVRRGSFWLGFGLVAAWMSLAPLVGGLAPLVGVAAAARVLAGEKLPA